MMSPANHINQLEHIVRTQMGEIDRLRGLVDQLQAKNARLQTRLDALMDGFNADGMLGVLRSIAHDTSLRVEVRTRAAAAGLPFEKPKLSMTATANVPKLFDILERARLKDLEERQAKTINQPPKPPVLASDHEAIEPDHPPAA
jgi:hypothetical protein